MFLCDRAEANELRTPQSERLATLMEESGRIAERLARGEIDERTADQMKAALKSRHRTVFQRIFEM